MEEINWQDYKLEIARLYLGENKTLANVMKAMEETHGIRKSERQYRQQLDRWGFKKYSLGASRLAGMKRPLTNVDGDKEVYVDRIRHCPKRLMREANRQVYTRTIETFTTAASPQTPEGFVICSPGPSVKSFQWPITLPWFQFSRMLQVSNLRGTSLLSTSKSSSMSQDIVQLLPQAQTDMLSFLGSTLPWKTTGRLTSIQSSSRLAAVLSVIMPEEKEGDHLQLSEKLCKAYSFPAQELLHILLFILSNNVNLEGVDDGSGQPRKDRLVMQLFHLSGLSNVQNVKYLLSQPDTTSEAVVESLFGSALRAHDITAIELLLRAGTNPDMPVHNGFCGLISPLATVANANDEGLSIKLTKMLIAHGANLNSTSSSPSEFDIAFRRGKCELLRFLLSLSHNFPHEIIRDASSYNAKLPIIQVLLESGMDIDIPTWRHSGNACTLVGMSVQNDNMELLNLLVSSGANLEAPQTIDIQLPGFWVTDKKTTALGLAALKGNMRMVQALLNMGARIDLSSVNLTPPLILAVRGGHTEAVQLLLAEGAQVPAADFFLLQREPSRRRTLVTFALEEEDPELLRTVLTAGSKPSIYEMAHVLSLFLKDSIIKNKIESVAHLINMGVRLSTWMPDGDHYNPLSLAIAHGNCEIISLLSNAGAELSGEGTNCSIANIRTLNHLEVIGLLPAFLNFHGRNALLSAIVLNKNDIAMTLLEYDADRRGIYNTQSSTGKNVAIFKTPLEAAICRGNLMLAEILIGRGAPITELEVAAFVWRILETDDDEFREFHPFWESLYSWRPSAPTAIAMALESDDHALIHRLLHAGLDPRGRPMEYDEDDVMDWIKNIEKNDEDAFPLSDPKCGMVAGWWNFPVQKMRYEVDSALEIAVLSVENPSVLQSLLKFAWTREAKGRAFAASLRNNRQELAQILLSSNADVNQWLWHNSELQGCCVSAPLLIAVGRRDLPLTRSLIAAGCDVNLCLGDEEEGTTTILGEAVKVGDDNILKTLLAAGAQVNSPCGSTNALNISVSEQRLDLTEILLEAGANVNKPPYPKFGRTALQIAVEKGNFQIVECLLEAGADVNQGPALHWGATALQLAAMHGFIGIACRLIDIGANVNALGARFDGRTALEAAAEHGHRDTVRLLLDSGASVEGDARRQYWRAVLLAERNGAYATVNFLKSVVGWTEFDVLCATKDILKDADTMIEIEGILD